MSQHVHVVGTVANDPVQFPLKKGGFGCSFRLASNSRVFDKATDKWVDGRTDWFNIIVYDSLAENVISSFHKGERVLLQGKLQITDWVKDDKTGKNVEIIARSIGHDLKFGTSSFMRNDFKTATNSAAQDIEAEFAESVPF